MSAHTTPAPLPNVGEILGRLLERVPAPQQPLFVAIAERLAAERYRRWAEAAPPEQREGLLACSAREESIASRIESLHEDVAAQPREIRAAVPELADLNRTIFADRPLAEQYAIQAQGERIGAALWRSLAKAATAEPARRTYLECAALEEQSAQYLESLIR